MGDSRVRYARNGDVRLAYRVFGDSGPVVIWVPGWVVSNVDTMDAPESPYARAVELLSAASRLVVWDRRGSGLSDPATHLLSLDERMDDLCAVVDATEDTADDRPTLFGSGEGGAITILFAATFPERLRSLVLLATAARYSQDLPDFPSGFTAAEIEAQLDDIDNRWGDGALFELFHGEASDVPGARDMFGKLQRSMMSPAMAKLWWRALTEVDVRGVLRSVRAPTLVLARPGDRLVPIEAAAALAADIPNATFLSFPPGPHNQADIIDDLASHILNFVCDAPSAPVEERVLKTVMFTDIVGSTQKLSARGDAHWRHQLDNHDRLVDSMLSRYGGVRANHTGDGIFALFDAPTKAVRCALDLVPGLATREIPIRVGIHTGECERRGQEWSGMAVHTGARIGTLAAAGEVLTSRTVRDLSAGSGLVFESLGPQQLKGLPDEVDVYRVATPRTRG